MSYAVVVEFEINPEKIQRFKHRVTQQAADSLNNEEGCLVFEVWASNDKPNQIYLYEIYTDKAAFDLHLETDHFTEFDRDVADWVLAKKVGTWGEMLA